MARFFVSRCKLHFAIYADARYDTIYRYIYVRPKVDSEPWLYCAVGVIHARRVNVLLYLLPWYIICAVQTILMYERDVLESENWRDSGQISAALSSYIHTDAPYVTVIICDNMLTVVMHCLAKTSSSAIAEGSRDALNRVSCCTTVRKITFGYKDCPFIWYTVGSLD